MNKTDYLCWLMNQCQLEAEGPDGYLHLCDILHRTYFLSMIEFDENRTEEGKMLRDEWMDTEGGDTSALEDLIPYSCTMLELILVMARRMAYEMMDSQYEAGVGKWVQELLENAGLATFRNDYFETDPDYQESRIRAILKDIIYHRYARTGEGGFFPLYTVVPAVPQPESELLTQMNNYLAANYDIC